MHSHITTKERFQTKFTGYWLSWDFDASIKPPAEGGETIDVISTLQYIAHIAL